MAFKAFKTGFIHPVHPHPVFNMSDPMHILKKAVNALWHSDIPTKQRQLGMWRADSDGRRQFARFSLKTGERVYNTWEVDGETLTLEERMATLKVLSGTIIGAIRDYQKSREDE
ncbi:unnamed protein product, partial [Ectocarpus sp. 12 AP-2014]